MVKEWREGGKEAGGRRSTLCHFPFPSSCLLSTHQRQAFVPTNPPRVNHTVPKLTETIAKEFERFVGQSPLWPRPLTPPTLLLVMLFARGRLASLSSSR